MPTVSKKVWDELVRRGLVTDPGNKGKGAKKRQKGAETVAPSFTPPGTWVVPLKTRSEANNRDWRSRSARTQEARRAVSKALGPHLRDLAPVAEAYHRGLPVRATITRIGGAKVDVGNLSVTLKAVEDFVCLVLGADDGDPRWRPTYLQEPGGPMGVRIELEALEAP